MITFQEKNKPYIYYFTDILQVEIIMYMAQIELMLNRLMIILLIIS